MTEEKLRLHAEVFGDVQGVGFRAFVWHRAMALGLTGWVRNRVDGSVELTAEGPRAALESLLKDVNIGPSASTVDHVEATWKQATSEFRAFGLG
jgi:acylphosphatase